MNLADLVELGKAWTPIAASIGAAVTAVAHASRRKRREQRQLKAFADELRSQLAERDAGLIVRIERLEQRDTQRRLTPIPGSLPAARGEKKRG